MNFWLFKIYVFVIVDGWWSLQDVFKYYTRNLERFTALIHDGDLDKILRPGRYTLEPVNNIEKILKFADLHFQPVINATAER